jgi:hypothetical protein
MESGSEARTAKRRLMPRFPDIEQTFQSLLAEGQLESSGSFQIDVRLAREKMRHFAWPEPRFLVLKILQGLIGLKCTSVDMTLPSTLEAAPLLEIRAAHPSPDELVEARFTSALGADLTLESGENPYSALATGLAAAISGGSTVALFVQEKAWLIYKGKRERDARHAGERKYSF